MDTIALAADATTFIVNGTPINDTEAGDYITITYTNPTTSRVDSGKSVTIQGRADGDVATILVNVTKKSASDAFLLGLKNSKAPAVLKGSVKEVYSKNGVESVETYSFQAGSLTDPQTDTKNDLDGNSMMPYTITARVTRLL